MRVVSRAEGDLLRTLDVVLHRAPVEALPEPLRNREWTAFSADAIALIQRRLTAGIVEFLARRGWRRERFLRDGRPQSGRLWQRHAPDRMGLTFSSESIRLLITLASDPGSLGAERAMRTECMTLGDRLLGVLAVAALQRTERGVALIEDPALSDDGLCRLVSPGLGNSSQSADFGRWLERSSVWIPEALQPWLAACWESFAIQPVPDSGSTSHHEAMLDSYLAALESVGRRDLARFLLMAAHRAARRITRLSGDSTSIVAGSGSSRDHQASLIRRLGLGGLCAWERWARTVGYFDEGYAEAQFWLSDWERLEGDSSFAERPGDVALRVTDTTGTPPGRPFPGA